MNTHIPHNVMPLYTFQNRSGDFVNVLARAEYQGQQIDITAVEERQGLVYVVEGTTYTKRKFSTDAARPTLQMALNAAVEAFESERLTTLAKKFGTYEVAKK